jgi:hypothetical protein
VPCEVYQRLTKEIEIAKSTFAVWTNPQNEHLRSATSKRTQAKEKKAASHQLKELVNERFRHSQSCDECKKTTSQE